MCLLDAAGVGLSHCLGVGGRDLKAAVGGRSTRQALRALAEDPATETVIVVSKPPDDAVLAEVEAGAAELGLRVHWAVLGAGRPDLTASVEAFLEAEGHPVPQWPATVAPADEAGLARGAALRGLFCGGTLADEAMTVAEAELGGIRSNIAHHPDLLLGPDLRDDGHVVIDFGDDGAHPRPRPPDDRPHAADGADRGRGRGPHLRRPARRPRARPRGAPRPGGRARRRPARGARDGERRRPGPPRRRVAHRDRRRPAGPARCAEVLASAGASVLLSNAAATRHALDLLRSRAMTASTPPLHGLLEPTRSSRPPGCRCSPTPCATRPCR